MSLPILKITTAISPAALARQYVQSELMLSHALCDALPIEVQAFCCPDLDAVPQANRVLDAYMVDVAAVERSIQTVRAAFSAAGQSVREWSVNPTLPAEVREKLEEMIVADGYRRRGIDLLLLKRPPSSAVIDDELQVIPARTSHALTRQLFATLPLPNAAALAQAIDLWLDEPRLDSLLALKAGVPVGYVAVQTMGQVGRILHLAVSASHRRQGIGAALLGRALEVCARSLFHHVFATGDDPATRRLLAKFGFAPAATTEIFELPVAR